MKQKLNEVLDDAAAVYDSLSVILSVGKFLCLYSFEVHFLVLSHLCVAFILLSSLRWINKMKCSAVAVLCHLSAELAECKSSPLSLSVQMVSLTGSVKNMQGVY